MLFSKVQLFVGLHTLQGSQIVRFSKLFLDAMLNGFSSLVRLRIVQDVEYFWSENRLGNLDFAKMKLIYMLEHKLTDDFESESRESRTK